MKDVPLAALAITAAACGSDGPAGPNSGDPFDPQQSNEQFAALGAALDGNADVLTDLGYVSNVLDTLSANAALVAPIGEPSTGLMQPVQAARLAVVGVDRVSATAEVLLPSDLLGKTFEWSLAENGYVVTTRDGAPVNGIRFILYDRTVAPTSENEVGYADVTDDSDPSADRLGVTLVKDGITRLDYDIEVTAGTSSAAASIDGFVTDGNAKVDFAVEETLSETVDGFRVDVDYSMSLADEPLSVHLVYALVLGDATTADFTATFVNGANTLVLDISQDAQGAYDGRVNWNGDLVMTVTGDGTGDPVFLGPEGEQLTPEEAQAIQEMFEIASEGLEFLAQYFVFLGGGLG
jgi:hypothetical protein